MKSLIKTIIDFKRGSGEFEQDEEQKVMTRLTTYQLVFCVLDIGEEFTKNGNRWVKRSTRTAYLKNKPHIWFYFRNKDIINISR